MFRGEGTGARQEVSLTISLVRPLASGDRLYEIGDRGCVDGCFSRLVSSSLSVIVVFHLPQQVEAAPGRNHRVETVIRKIRKLIDMALRIGDVSHDRRVGPK